MGSQVLQFAPPLHCKQTPKAKLYPTAHEVQFLFVLQERSGLQTSPFKLYPPTQEEHLDGSDAKQSLQGSLHCGIQVLLTNLSPGLH